jgi:hypothetical protein
MFLIQMNEKNVATDEIRTKEECAVAWTPILLLDNARLITEVRATTESFRDEMVASNNKATEVMVSTAVAIAAAQQRFLGN